MNALLADVPSLSLTVADVALLPSELAGGPVVYELDRGQLVIMAPPGNFTIFAQMRNKSRSIY